MKSRSFNLPRTIKCPSAFDFRALAVALLGAGLIGGAQAAMLGDIQVRSALGERFNAAITVAAADDEELTASCFRLVSPQDENAHGVLRRAKLTYQYEVGGGRLLVRGDEAANEPLVTLAIRVKCPGEEERVFQRDYRILLDPPEYRPNIALPATQGLSPSNKNTAPRRKLPAMGSAWLTEEGDSVAKIAASYYPGDKARQQALVEAIYDLNPDLPQNTNARLAGDWRILLPMPSPKADRSPLVTPPRAERLVAAPKTLEALPRLTLGTDLSVAPNQPSLPSDVGVAEAGEFRLRLSEITLDTSQKSTLTPEQTLQLRERLLALESDDQAAQMLQLKYQITELEKKLASFQANPAADRSADGGESGGSDLGWGLWPLLALLLLPLGFLTWRRWQQRDANQEDFYTVISPSTAYLRTSTHAAPDSDPRSRNLTLGGLNGEEFGTPIRREQQDDWHNADMDEMDVVSPGNVAEEAQLLLDHGLVPQAINLLNHEIGQMPSALALWMKLFEIYQRNGMAEAFQEKAVAFRLQFASDALWQNVQELGLSIDPANPLYQSLELSPQLPIEPQAPMFEVRAADQAFATALHVDADLEPLDGVLPDDPWPNAAKSATDPLTLADTEHSTSQSMDLIYRSPSEATEPEDEMDEPIQLQPLDNQPEEFEIQIDAVQSIDALEIQTPLAPAAKEAKAAPEFKSDDPALQAIAALIDSGQRKEAFQLLEEMLYKGSMPQRLTASKWLDKMLGSFGHQ